MNNSTEKTNDSLPTNNREISEDPGTKPAKKGSRKKEDKDGKAKEKQPSPTELLLKHVKSSGIELFHDERREPYAVIHFNEKRSVLPVESKDFRDLLCHSYYDSTGFAISKDAVGNVIQQLCGEAKYGSGEKPLHTRYAWHEDSIWVDLDGSRAIKIDGTGWDIVDEPPVLFRQFPHQCALPIPLQGGNPTKLLDLLNISDINIRNLLMGYMVACMIPGIPLPVLIIHGQQGTGKTTILKAIKRLIDPSTVLIQGEIRKENNYALSAWKHWLLFFDNLSSIPKGLSDRICRTSTGDGYETRTLYTNLDSTILEYRRGVGIASINQLADKPDLLERAWIISPDLISPSSRLQEGEFWKRFYDEAPSILGGLLDALSKAIRIKDIVKLDGLPRMADFAHWACAGALAMGIKQQDFQLALDTNTLRQNQAAIDANPFAQVVIKMMDGRESFTGSPGEFLKLVNSVAEDMQISTKAKGWPNNTTWVSRRLKEIILVLNSIGLDVQIVHKTLGSEITIKRIRKSEPVSPKDGEGAQMNIPDHPHADDTPVQIPKKAQADSITSQEIRAIKYEGILYSLNPEVWPEPITYEYEERIGILTMDGDFHKDKAREKALNYIKREYGSTESPKDDKEWKLA